MKYHTLAAMWLPILVLIGGTVALVAFRRRSPRATLLALPVVVLLAVFDAYVPTRMLIQVVGVRQGRPPEWLSLIVGYGMTVLSLTFPVVITVAAMMDRQPGGRDGNA